MVFISRVGPNSIVDVVVRDLAGVVVRRLSIAANETTTSLDVSELTNGIYSMEFRTAYGVTYRMLTVVR
jgi:hypothetical protein